MAQYVPPSLFFVLILLLILLLIFFFLKEEERKFNKVPSAVPWDTFVNHFCEFLGIKTTKKTVREDKNFKCLMAVLGIPFIRTVNPSSSAPASAPSSTPYSATSSSAPSSTPSSAPSPPVTFDNFKMFLKWFGPIRKDDGKFRFFPLKNEISVFSRKKFFCVLSDVFFCETYSFFQEKIFYDPSPPSLKNPGSTETFLAKRQNLEFPLQLLLPAVPAPPVPKIEVIYFWSVFRRKIKMNSKQNMKNLQLVGGIQRKRNLLI